MGHIHILHARSAAQFAEDLAHGLEREGYTTTWDGQHGALAAMSGKTLDLAQSSCCIPLWTRDLMSAKWTREAVENAHERDALVELTLDPIESPIESAIKPLDFSAWRGEFEGPLWKAFMARVRDVAGRPTGRLPLKEEAPPALSVMALGAAAVVGLVLGGVPGGHVKSDSLADLGRESIDAGPNVSVGGPTIGLREPASATTVFSAATAPAAHFDRLAPAPKVQIVPLKDFEAAPSEMASAAPDALNTDETRAAPDNPIL